MIYFILSISNTLAVLDFSSPTFPFPSDNLTSNSTTDDSSFIVCADDLISDGKCDLSNNTPQCRFDGGDCCKPTCETFCKNCSFPCGASGYFCIDPNVTTCSNCVHGKCSSMASCFSDIDLLKTGILNCWKNSIAHGNSSTADFYCGKDPMKTMIHNSQDYSFHYPGCGIEKDLCSAYQCCTDIKTNNITAENCGNTVETYSFYNYSSKKVENSTGSCLEIVRNCFRENDMISNGQCCQCDSGWVGKNCNISTCYPNCKNGVCTSINSCYCYEGWTGADCSQAICSKCVNGACIAPNICVCNDGWNGTACDTPYAVPDCVYGISTSPGVCKCSLNYTGLRCDIPICARCNNGWCVAPNICECYPPYYTKDPSVSWCTDLYCSEIFGTSCINCTNTTCTKCLVGYYLNKTSCIDCVSLNIHCLECGLGGCLRCTWPFVAKGFDCLFGGYLELASKYFSVFKNNNTAEIPVYRIGPTADPVMVSYKLIEINARYRGLADFGYVEGSLYFDPGVSVQKINIPIYNRFTDASFPVNFYIILYNPVGAIFFSQNLTNITDFTWSDKGISIISYCIVEIWDDLNQASPQYTSFSQPYPATSTVNGYSFNFTAFNSLSQPVVNSVFVVQVRLISQVGVSQQCVFSSNSFEDPSALFSFTKAAPSGSYYISFFALPRGAYTLTAFSALSGAYVRIFTNSFFQGPAVEEGIRKYPGWYNNYTRPLGNSTSAWEFIYFPGSSFSASLVVECSYSDSLAVRLNEGSFFNCIGSCSSVPVTLSQGFGYNISISYLHQLTSPGFTMYFKNGSTVYNLNEVYAVYRTPAVSQLFVLNQSEC